MKRSTAALPNIGLPRRRRGCPNNKASKWDKEAKFMKKLGKFFLNGILLTTCSVLMRTVAVSFNIYVAQKAGAEAMGLYSLLTGIYGFALTGAFGAAFSRHQVSSRGVGARSPRGRAENCAARSFLCRAFRGGRHDAPPFFRRAYCRTLAARFARTAPLKVAFAHPAFNLRIFGHQRLFFRGSTGL